MDFVYILGNGSRWSNNEIRYSLRSLRYVNHDKVFIVGSLPHFVKEVFHIPVEDYFNNKQANAIRKILIACKCSEISDDFVLMNDDFFFLKHFKEIPYYYLGDLDYLLSKYKDVRSKYYYATLRGKEYCKSKRISLNNFEVHYPIVINKKKFIKIFDKTEWLKNPTIYRSVYANYYKINGIPLQKDFKCYTIKDFNRKRLGSFISADNSIVFNHKFRKFLKTKYPKKCKYEK